ncbi:hypothetical protein CN151_16325 [Sinorhizobium meliloti]|uniref:hypothetical protein n=1 Tax=Rhizobium meliloti TaxID=382 RepID=UPI00028614EF|nr:hypothetical protein [Sinorhizobium meliloti]MQW18305.1 hypothetical protein [Sinorhizobium meliloti]QND25672.1 hypothetical protein HB773_03880 [Sinorhizobium meliloti]RMI21067.1 hypothetical protein DA102_000440 [Sinorhizobium meliloti]RVH99076.1 hypothetical protein CN199_01885 [Sinorhizobium meliloti]RVK39796.1 hypothetical protein CN161_00595 [Sinorhizobium meliloti]
MTAYSEKQHRLFLALVENGVEVARRKGKMTEVDALLGLQFCVALNSEAIVGSRQAAASLRDIADQMEQRGLEPLRLPKKNIVADDEA